MAKNKRSVFKWLISRLLTLAFFVYMALLLYFLFFSEQYGRTLATSEYHYNLKLFLEIRRFYHIGGREFVINVIGNVLAFLPFGFLIPVIYREQRKKTVQGHYFRCLMFVTFLGGMFSFFVECVQLVTKVGSFDVDDMLLNTVGVFLGVIGYIISKGIIRKMS